MCRYSRLGMMSRHRKLVSDIKWYGRNNIGDYWKSIYTGSNKTSFLPPHWTRNSLK